jgi:hypothetical protein
MHTKSTFALCALLAMTAVSASSAADPTASARPQTRAETTMNQRSNAATAPTTDRSTAATPPQAGSNADRSKFAAKESASPGAKNYKGGDDVVIISAGTTALILGIVLLVILL